MKEKGTKTLQEVRDEYAASLPEDAKDRVGKIKYNGAKQFLRGLIDTFEGDVKEAIQVLAGTGQRGGGAVRSNPKKAVLAVLKEKVSMSNMDCFMEFNKGPAEMRDLMKYAVREVEPKDRVWIEFKADTYTVVATGEDAPADWDGYMPVKTEMTV